MSLQHGELIRETYTSVLFQMMEKGLTGPLHRRLAIELTAEVATKLAYTEIAPEDVEQVLSYEDS